MLKKTFSVHISKTAYAYLTENLCLPAGIAIDRACAVALKDLLNCDEPEQCARRICQIPAEFNESLESPRIVVSSTKCERAALDLAAKTLNVSPNQAASVLTNFAILRDIKDQQIRLKAQDTIPGIEESTRASFSLNQAQTQAISHLMQHGWDQSGHLLHENQTPLTSDTVENPSTTEPQIHYLEMGTGAGKTLLALTLACEEAKSHRRTWIAVPSLSVQKQFLSEFKLRFGPRNSVLLSLVSGRAEFVSEQRLSSLIEQHQSQTHLGQSNSAKRKSSSKSNLETPDPKFDWVKKALNWMNHLADKDHGIDRRRWLVDSFLEHVEGFPYSDSDICLNSEVPGDDPGHISYHDQFDLADRADIVVLTHHYLSLETISRLKAGLSGLKKDDTAKSVIQALYADSRIGRCEQNRLTRSEVLDLIDQRNQILSSFYDPNEVGRLNLPETLIVDEAHLLEENFSKASSIKISVRRLPTLFSEVAASKGIKTDQSISLIQKSLQNLSAKLSSITVANQNASVFLNWNSPPSADKTVVGLVEDLATLMTSFSVSGSSQEAISLRSAQYAFSRMLKSARYNVALFTNSPIRQYPQILFGSSNHTAEFRLLFRNMGITRTLLLSATIYLPNIAGAWSSTRFLSGLGLQASEANGYRSSQEPWLFDPVTLFLPPKPSDISRDFGTGQNVLYPANEAKLTKIWLSQLCVFAQWVAQTAQGGTLILMTSYDAANQLNAQMAESDPAIASRLLLSQPRSGHTVAELKKEFVSLYLKGEKPVWIAVGNAWTGLNLAPTDIPCDQDNLLTDLIVSRTPYGLNRSISAAAKSLTSARHIQSLEEAGLTLKQGVGRLIRRPGVPKNRRLFFMDSRIYDKDKKTLLNMSNALLRNYTNRDSIPRAVIRQMIQRSETPNLKAAIVKKKQTENTDATAKSKVSVQRQAATPKGDQHLETTKTALKKENTETKNFGFRKKDIGSI